jgi:hypothetical protein
VPRVGALFDCVIGPGGDGGVCFAGSWSPFWPGHRSSIVGCRKGGLPDVYVCR